MAGAIYSASRLGRPSTAHWLTLAVICGCIASVVARKQHDAHTIKHKHTYLHICADADSTTSHVCIHQVKNTWPQPALMDKTECAETADTSKAPGTTDSNCDPAAATINKNLYAPITIPIGTVTPAIDYRTGADVDRFTDGDRVRCKDGELFATGWYKKYTPQECARLCAKIQDYYGKNCTHFTRQWITSDIKEHADSCGRDGDAGLTGGPLYGTFESAGTGAGQYTHRGQCIFFNSANDECCATKAAWRETLLTQADSDHCQSAYGDRKDNWNSKHRSWRLSKQGFDTTNSRPAWPVTSRGRRLSAYTGHVDGEDPLIHELVFTNGTKLLVNE